MDVITLLQSIGITPNCVVHPPSGLPVLEDTHVLPEDMRTFYQLCGGADLFTDDVFTISIVAPSKVVVANPIIIPSLTEEQFSQSKSEGEISWSWYIIGEGEPSMGGQYLTIDLNPERLGRCYNSFWDVHPHSSEVIAHSFTGLLIRLLEGKAKGNIWYWNDPSFKSLGSAYD